MSQSKMKLPTTLISLNLYIFVTIVYKLLMIPNLQKLNLVPNTHTVQAQLRNSTKTFDDILRDWEDEFMNRKSRKGGNNQQQQQQQQQQQPSTKSRRSRKKRKK